MENYIAHLDPVAYAHPGVLPYEAINPYVILGPVLPVGPPDLGCGDPLAFYLYDVPRGEPEGQEGIGVQPGYAPGRVIGVGLGNLEQNIFHFPHTLGLF